MIGLDTNVLLRWIAVDPDNLHQGELAAQALSGGTADVFISALVLAEVIWVLERTYRQPKAQLVDVIELILATTPVTMGDRRAVEDALQSYQSAKCGFSDCLIAVLNRRAGCTTTLTFDKTAAKSPDFTLLA